MGWMHDILTYVGKDPVYRRWEHQHLTFSMLYAFNENFVLPFSHDEVVHGKRSMMDKVPGDVWQKAATLRSLYALHVHASRQEAPLHGRSSSAQWREWDHDDVARVAPARASRSTPGCSGSSRDLNTLYRRRAARSTKWTSSAAGFSWIDCNDCESSVISFVRRAQRSAATFVVVVLNWTPVVRYGYRIGVPEPGYYAELLNSDAGAVRRQQRRATQAASRPSRSRHTGTRSR